MAQRQKVQKTKRVERAFVFQVFSNLALQRLKVRKDILVSKHHTLGLGGGAGSKNDLDGIARSQILRRISLGGKGGKRLAQRLEGEGGQTDVDLRKMV